MKQYCDISLDGMTALVKESKKRGNPAFFVSPFARNIAWAFFSCKIFLSGKITASELARVFIDGKKEGLVKKKVKELSEQELLSLFKGCAPRLTVGNMSVVPHNTSIAGLIDFLTLLQQIIVDDQYHAREFLTSDSIVIDAGANIGTFTVFAASIAEKGKVYAFEPGAPARATLIENVRNATNVSVVPFGLGEKSDSREMRVNAEFPGFSAFSDTGFAATGGISDVVLETVKIVTIDDFVKENALPSVDFIKMDTEGYEKNIIRGARETIKRFKPVIAASAYHYPNDKIDIPALIQEIEPGYRHILSHRAEEDFIFWLPR
jgi:FkbM family methyltransferase